MNLQTAVKLNRFKVGPNLCKYESCSDAHAGRSFNGGENDDGIRDDKCVCVCGEYQR